MRALGEVVARKRAGIDCTEDESALVKRYFDDYAGTDAETDEDSPFGLFPLEYAEWAEEILDGRRERV